MTLNKNLQLIATNSKLYATHYRKLGSPELTHNLPEVGRDQIPESDRRKQLSDAQRTSAGRPTDIKRHHTDD